MQRCVLIVEDEEVIRRSLTELLSGEGYVVSPAGNVSGAIDLARSHDFDVALCDVQLPDGDGIDLLKRILRLNPRTSILVFTAYATVDNAVEAFKAGAFDYLVKPVIFDDLLNKLKRLFQFWALDQENQALRRELAWREDFDLIVGSSSTLADLQDAIRKVAKTNANVLLVGETGTGKELFARAIHRAGPKSHEKFLAVNCSTRPVELLEAQLFGSKLGALAGTGVDQVGIFQHAGAGTVLLDEISELPLSIKRNCCGRSSIKRSCRSAGRSRCASGRGSSRRRRAT